MHITALVKGPEHACCRYRVAAFRPSIESLGHTLEIRAWSSGWFFQQLFPGLARPIDVLLVQRKLLAPWQLKILRKRARCLIYDFDDSIFLRSSYNPLGHDCPKRFAKFRAMVQNADLVVAGNDFLREQAEALIDPFKVVHIATCVDVRRYPLARPAADKPTVKLVWIGSASTLRGLERIRELLDRLADIPRLELRIICDRRLHLDRLPIEFRPWSEVTETRDLAEADIGISWLPDDRWSEGKCGLKVLQYMAAGLPVVANAVGVQRTLVRSGENGFLAESADEWFKAIERLANDAALRWRLGSAGRRRVESEFDVANGASAWTKVLQSIDAARCV